MSPHKKTMDFSRRGCRVLRWVQEQGAVFYSGRQERELLKSYLQGMGAIFPELVRQLSAIYLYRQSEQSTEHLRRCDGILWKYVTTDGYGTLYAVGLSLEAVAYGPAYAQFLFIHELCHIGEEAGGDIHDERFKERLSALLGRYNQATGAHLTDEP